MNDYDIVLGLYRFQGVLEDIADYEGRHFGKAAIR